MRFVIRNRNQLIQAADKFAAVNDQKPYTLTIEPLKRPRTTPQNAKFHAMIDELACHTGHSPAEIKDFVKTEFGHYKTIKIGEDFADVTISTADYTVEQMQAMIERLYQLGADCGCEFREVA